MVFFGWSEDPKAESKDESEADYPECDYDTNLTPLYEAIEERAWIAVNQFLHSGYWPESLFADEMSPEDQARTWVTRYETRPDGSKKVRWSQLPIHAAVIFGAPSVVIQQLVECFPQSVRCTDDHRMLPLHLAFRHGSDDSVIALFLEEFPEAVNVRGYKGRLPVECASKGPNPERGAIIRTILQKNQSAWERKKSAVQLKELYCVKEALKIKSQKVSHLETAIREIKSREHKTRKELGLTMTELRSAKIKTKDMATSGAKEDYTADKLAVKQLVEKLAALEMATKDLVDKEKTTRRELKKTQGELEAAKRMKPTEDQAKHFAQLDKVASKEDDNALKRNEAGGDEIKQKESKVSAAGKSAVSSKKVDPSIASSEKKKGKKKKNKKAAESPSVPAPVQAPAPAPAPTAEPPKAPAPAPVTSKPIGSGSSVYTHTSKTTVKTMERPPLPHSHSRELEKQRLRIVEETNKALEKKIASLESSMKGFAEKASQKQEELDAVIAPATSKLNEEQTEQMTALQAEMKNLKDDSDKAKEELDQALSQLNDFKANQEANATAALLESEKKQQETEEANKKLEKKVALLELALTQFEQKTNMAKEEMNNIKTTISLDSNVHLTPTQEKHLKVLEGAMKKLEKNAKKTKKELESALVELDEVKKAKEEQEEIQKIQAKQAQAEREALEAKEARLRAEQEAAEAKLRAEEQARDAKRAREEKEEEQRKLKIEHEKLMKEKRHLLIEQKKLQNVSQANKELESKITTLEATMKQFEDKANKTKEEMERAMQELKKSDASTVASGESMKLTKKQKKHMEALESAMLKLEERASHTKTQLDEALEELDTIKKSNEVETMGLAMSSKKEDRAMKDLAKKVQALQSAMVGFEVKETKTVQELEKTMKELEEQALKRFEVLSVTAEHTRSLATDPKFTKEVEKLEKRASKEERRVCELEATVKEILEKSGSTKDELESTKKLLAEIQAKHDDTDTPVTKAEKEEAKQDKKIIKELTKKVATLQSAVIGFEVKETRTMKELEHTMKQLEDLTSKRFEVLEKAAALKEKETEKLAEAGALAEEKVATLHVAMKELEQNAKITHEELAKTKMELDAMKEASKSGEGASKQVLAQDTQIKELNEKISVLQQAVMGFEVKETKTMQELEQTMKQLEELTAKRFEVLQKVAGREIEAAKAAEASKYTQKAAQEEKKVAALEFAMRELESKAYKTKLELERTMKGLEHLEEKQTIRQQEVTGVTKEEKRVMRELVSKVADIQEAVMAYDEKETKTVQELEQTRKELEQTRKEVEALRARQGNGEAESVEKAEAEVEVFENEDNQSQVQIVDVKDESSVAAETAKRVTEETLTSLESAIHRLVERLATEDEAEQPKAATGSLAPSKASSAASASKVGKKEDEIASGPSKEAEEEEAPKASSVAGSKASSGAERGIAPGPSKEEQMIEVERVATKEDMSGGIKEPEVVTATPAPASPAVAPSAVASAPATSMEAPKETPAAPVTTPAAVVEEPKAVTKRSWFGRPSKRNNSRKSSTVPVANDVAETKNKKKFGLFGKKKSSKSSTPAATPEQRKSVAATHGPEIAAVLNDQQILDIIRKTQTPTQTPVPPSTAETPLTPIVETVLSAASKADSTEVKSALSAASAKSIKSKEESVDLVEEDPKSLIVSLPSQRSMRSKSGSVAPLDTAPSASSPAGTPKSKKSPQNDILVTAGTYDDGFEINF